MRSDTDNSEESERLLAYLAAERQYHDAAMESVSSTTTELYEAMVRLTPDDETSVEWADGGYLYSDHTPAGAELGQFRRRRSASDPHEVLVDLAAAAEQGDSTYAEFGVREISPDGRFLAYSIDLDGDEVYEMRILDLTSGQELPESMPRTYYGAAWSADSRHLFYVVHDACYRPFQIWRHEIGTPVTSDSVVLQEDDRHFDVDVRATRSGAWIIITALSRDTSEVWGIPADDPLAPARSFAVRRPKHEYHVEHAPTPATDRFLILTDSDNADGSPGTEFRIVACTDPWAGEASWAEVVAARADVRLTAVEPFANHVAVGLRTAGEPRIRICDHELAERFEIRPDRVGGTLGFGPNREFGADSLLVRVESLIDPAAWLAVDVSDGSRTTVHRQDVPGYDPTRYAQERIWITARDGIRVPVVLARARTTALDGTAGCLLYGYGSYESVEEPDFHAPLIPLLDRGVVFALAGVRGGGDLGRAWWNDGHLSHKHRSFDDFVDVARSLGGNVVDSNRIVTRGGSAGGLLVTASMNQAPDLFAGVIAQVPFVDVVTSMLDADMPLTVNEWDEWGDPTKPEEYAFMVAYSPMDNILPGGSERPFVLVTGAVNDPRVQVHEPAKWVAKMRASADDGAAVSRPGLRGGLLFRVELGEGSHGGAAGRFAYLHDEAMTQTVALASMGMA